MPTIEIQTNKQIEIKKFQNFNLYLEQITKDALFYAGLKCKKCSVSLLLCGDDEILELNKTFRKKDYITNVLSFPSGEKLDGVLLLGDIAICIPKIKEEALEQNKTFKTHFLHMFTHGILHLLGYDHETPDEQSQMEKIEDSILDGLQKLKLR